VPAHGIERSSGATTCDAVNSVFSSGLPIQSSGALAACRDTHLVDEISLRQDAAESQLRSPMFHRRARFVDPSRNGAMSTGSRDAISA
jgi:hypothetical protein